MKNGKICDKIQSKTNNFRNVIQNYYKKPFTYYHLEVFLGGLVNGLVEGLE